MKHTGHPPTPPPSAFLLLSGGILLPYFYVLLLGDGAPLFKCTTGYISNVPSEQTDTTEYITSLILSTWSVKYFTVLKTISRDNKASLLHSSFRE